MTDDQFEKLAQLIQGSHEELSGKVDTLRADMNTEFGKVHEELAAIRAELADIRNRLDVLEEKVSQHAGYTKEIDHILARVIFIEQKLGIQSAAAD